MCSAGTSGTPKALLPILQVGQHQAREAAGLIVEMIRDKRMAGKALLIAGEGVFNTETRADFCTIRTCRNVTELGNVASSLLASCN